MTKGQRKAAARRIMRKRQKQTVGGKVQALGKACRHENQYYN